MQSEIDGHSVTDSLRQRITELEVRNGELETENAEIPELRKKLAEIPKLRKKLAKVKARNAELIKEMMEEDNRRVARIELLKAIEEKYARRDVEKAEFKAKIEELEKNRTDIVAENAELSSRVVKLEQDIVELKKELEPKKNRKFQEKCILVAQVLLGEEPIVEYRPHFLNGLELDAFFQKYRIALEVQGAQHRFHSTSWYKDIKKLEDIVNRDRQKRYICQDNGISLLEVWYDEKPEIVIPKRIRKIKEFVNQASKTFNL
jgi:DNA repair exonuclease SbcCD ATPase subunit